MLYLNVFDRANRLDVYAIWLLTLHHSSWLAYPGHVLTGADYEHTHTPKIQMMTIEYYTNYAIAGISDVYPSR